MSVNFHSSNFPEDSDRILRPTDVALHAFLDKFLDGYSWREDITRGQISLRVFNMKEGPATTGERELYNLLRWLRSKKYLSFHNVDDSGFLEIYDVDESALEALLDDLHPEIKPATIIYFPVERVVIYNGVKHKMRNRNLKLFDLLARNPNERISKEKVWRAIGFRASTKRERDRFSKIINDTRITLGATTSEIMLQDSVTLHAHVEISD